MSSKAVGVTDNSLIEENLENLQFINLEHVPNDPEWFRHSMRKLYTCDYLVVHELNYTTGVLVGYCFANNIPVIAKGVEIDGSFGNTDDDGYRELIESLNAENSLCVRTEALG